MLKMITVPQNQTLYKYSFKLNGIIYMGEFTSDNFWDADKRFKAIIHSYNESEWIRRPETYGAELCSHKRMWSEKDTLRHYYRLETEAEFDKLGGEYQEFADTQEKWASMLGLIFLVLILITGIFGGDILAAFLMQH